MKRTAMAIVILLLLAGAACDWKSALSWPSGAQLQRLYPELHLSKGTARCLRYNADTDDLMWYVECPAPHPHMLDALLTKCRDGGLTIADQTDVGFVATKGTWHFQVRTLPNTGKYFIYRIDRAERDFSMQDDFDAYVRSMSGGTG